MMLSRRTFLGCLSSLPLVSCIVPTKIEEKFIEVNLFDKNPFQLGKLTFQIVRPILPRISNGPIIYYECLVSESSDNINTGGYDKMSMNNFGYGYFNHIPLECKIHDKEEFVAKVKKDYPHYKYEFFEITYTTHPNKNYDCYQYSNLWCRITPYELGKIPPYFSAKDFKCS